MNSGKSRALCLDVWPERPHDGYCAPMVVNPKDSVVRHDLLTPLAWESLPEGELTKDEWLRLEALVSGRSDDGPFSRLDWFEDLEQWIKELPALGVLTLTGTVKQLNAAPSFALMRFDTSAGVPLWFKAVGPPNEHEFFYHPRARQKLVPEYLPIVLGEREGLARMADARCRVIASQPAFS